MPQHDLVFISYSHSDRKWLNRLDTMLKPYIRAGQLVIWQDPYIQVGARWQREISAALVRARVGVLLVSPDALASDFIWEVEIPALCRASFAQ